MLLLGWKDIRLWQQKVNFTAAYFKSKDAAFWLAGLQPVCQNAADFNWAGIAFMGNRVYIRFIWGRHQGQKGGQE